MTDRPQVKDMLEKDVTADVEMKEAAPAQEEKAEVDEKTLAQGEGTVYIFPVTAWGGVIYFSCIVFQPLNGTSAKIMGIISLK